MEHHVEANSASRQWKSLFLLVRQMAAPRTTYPALFSHCTKPYSGVYAVLYNGLDLCLRNRLTACAEELATLCSLLQDFSLSDADDS